jgi:hypothetical protein
MTRMFPASWVALPALAVSLAVPAAARADRGATCTLTVVQARDGEATPSIDPALAPLNSLLSVPPFTIYKVFKRLFVASLEFSTIPQERTVEFPGPVLTGLGARVTYSGYAAQGGALLFEFRLSKDGQTLAEPTIRLSGAPFPLVVPWPDPMNVLIFVFQCTPAPEPPAPPPS